MLLRENGGWESMVRPYAPSLGGDMSREMSLSIVIEAESISIPVEIKLIETPISVGQR
jgi:hypothetical protein